jgi:hypothetical protein
VAARLCSPNGDRDSFRTTDGSATTRSKSNSGRQGATPSSPSPRDGSMPPRSEATLVSGSGWTSSASTFRILWLSGMVLFQILFLLFALAVDKEFAALVLVPPRTPGAGDHVFVQGSRGSAGPAGPSPMECLVEGRWICLTMVQARSRRQRERTIHGRWRRFGDFAPRL